ncbi:hypothetical protein J6590_077334 [Homalodisca vitripennis]|nr:hypothetical protein J6590_077334 [Homalodisca vitripennis]
MNLLGTGTTPLKEVIHAMYSAHQWKYTLWWDVVAVLRYYPGSVIEYSSRIIPPGGGGLHLFDKAFEAEVSVITDLLGIHLLSGDVFNKLYGRSCYPLTIKLLENAYTMIGRLEGLDD